VSVNATHLLPPMASQLTEIDQDGHVDRAGGPKVGTRRCVARLSARSAACMSSERSRPPRGYGRTSRPDSGMVGRPVRGMVGRPAPTAATWSDVPPRQRQMRRFWVSVAEG